MSVASELIRGNTETIILAQLMKGDGYGYMVNKAILNLTGGRFELKEATLYTAFRRLEDAGCIVSYWGDETTARGADITPSPIWGRNPIGCGKRNGKLRKQ